MLCRCITSRPAALSRNRLPLNAFLQAGGCWRASYYDAARHPIASRHCFLSTLPRLDPTGAGSAQADIEEVDLPCRSNGAVKLE